MPSSAIAASMASLPRTALLAALLVPAAASLAAPPRATTVYCCQDPANGRRVCGDSLPEQCRGRPYRVLDGAGNVVKEVEGALSAEEKAARAAEAKRQKEEEAQQRIQRRKDQALLETYGSLEELDKTQAHDEAELLAAIRQAEEKISATRKERKRWEDEAEFYAKKTLPPDVDKGLRMADFEIRAQTALLESKKKDLEAVRAKYAEDRRRFVQIRGGARNGAAADARPR